MEKIAYLTRIESFSAAHRLHSSRLTDEENKATFGKCNHINGHGHNYKLEVTVRGRVNPATGMIMNVQDLKRVIGESVLDVLDHKFLDYDVTYFGDCPSTAENICIFIWTQIKEHLPPLDGISLHKVKLFETDKNVVCYRGE